MFIVISRMPTPQMFGNPGLIGLQAAHLSSHVAVRNSTDPWHYGKFHSWSLGKPRKCNRALHFRSFAEKKCRCRRRLALRSFKRKNWPSGQWHPQELTGKQVLLTIHGLHIAGTYNLQATECICNLCNAIFRIPCAVVAAAAPNFKMQIQLGDWNRIWSVALKWWTRWVILEQKLKQRWS